MELFIPSFSLNTPPRPHSSLSVVDAVNLVRDNELLLSATLHPILSHSVVIPLACSPPLRIYAHFTVPVEAS